MKKMKKLASLVLALAMALTLAVPAMAAEEKGSITISDAVVGQTYTIYQILELESYNNEAKAYSYKVAAGWDSFFVASGAGAKYVTITDDGYVKWKANDTDDGDDVKAFAKAAMEFAEANGIGSVKSITATDTTVTFTNLDLGYYLVDTTLGALCSLDTTTPTATVQEKNEKPSITKQVQEDSNDSWGVKNDADIGQIVNFKATITVQEAGENYIMHDTMSDGLTYNGVTAVKVDGAVVDASNYEVIVPDKTCGCTVEVKFNNDYIKTLESNTKIDVYYSAILNENAVVAGAGNPNTVKLQYNNSFTTEHKTTTYTWKMDVFKHNSESKALAGATFKLSTDDAGVNVIKFHAPDGNKYRVCAKAGCTASHVQTITTDATGAFFIEGLDADTYYLTETAAPAGYNKLTDPIEVVITAANAAEGEPGTVSYTVDKKPKTGTVNVLNQTGTKLPSTGGMGTTLFYALGAVLVIGAGVALVTKKRMG